jgi:hypothetical protein
MWEMCKKMASSDEQHEGRSGSIIGAAGDMDKTCDV